MTEMEKSEKLGVEGTYLSRNLREKAEKNGHWVVANYVCDEDDVIARKYENGGFQVASELKNGPDWRLFQELTAQADAIITGGAYLKRFAALGEKAENVIDQFAEGGQFADLGRWREEHGLKRNPDIVVVSRSLDFDIPPAALEGGRRVLVFTTDSSAVSKKAEEYRNLGAEVFGAGEVGVDGRKMIDYLTREAGYKVIKMTTGPRVLQILLDADALDELYITRVNRRIEAPESDVQRVLIGGGRLRTLPGFKYHHILHQEGVKVADGKIVSQDFGVYERVR
jgi:riboflavin biosynthesis pyrimidine reductase